VTLRQWVRLPSKWIEEKGLRHLRWSSLQGANHVAALMALAAVAHHADDETGRTRLTYDQLCNAVGLSRAKLAGGLDVLERLHVVQRAPEGRSTFQLVDYDRSEGWCKFPARGLYVAGRILAFDDFTLRKPVELHALKLYFLFAARRGSDTNMAHLSYEKIEDYSGVERHRIKSALSLLAANGLVFVERIPSAVNEHGIANAYRLAFLDSRVHMGTRGRAMEAF
jgi:hypothetical protein